MSPTLPPKDAFSRVLTLYQTGSLADAEKACSALLQRYPGAPPVLELAGLLCLRQQRFADAIVTYRKLAALQPAHHGAHLNLGLALSKHGRV